MVNVAAKFGDFSRFLWPRICWEVEFAQGYLEAAGCLRKAD